MRSNALLQCGWYVLSLALFYALKLAKIGFYICIRTCAYAGVNNQSERTRIHLHTYLCEKPRITTGLILRYYDEKKLFPTAKVQHFFSN